MKIRTGFVSNSSTSSFCIYGVYLNKSYKELQTICKEHNLTFHGTQPYSDYEYVIGREYSSIGDNETGAEFRKNVETVLLKVGITEKPVHCEEAWYDG